MMTSNNDFRIRFYLMMIKYPEKLLLFFNNIFKNHNTGNLVCGYNWIDT